MIDGPTRTVTAFVGELDNDVDMSDEVRTVHPSFGEAGWLVLAVAVIFLPWQGEPFTV